MLKIKFNINEFTIIFLRRFDGKNERKRIFFSVFSASALFSFVLCSGLFLSFLLFQPSSLFLFSATFPFSVQCLFFFFFSVSALLFFCFSVSAPLFLVFCFSLFLSFVQHHFSCFFRRVALFFQPKTILSSAQKHFFQAETFLLQPKTFFSSTHTTVSASFLFVGSVFSASFSSFFFSASFSFSCQLPRPKIFSLDASHFFYLNKSLFSSNLE